MRNLIIFAPGADTLIEVGKTSIVSGGDFKSTKFAADASLYLENSSIYGGRPPLMVRFGLWCHRIKWKH